MFHPVAKIVPGQQWYAASGNGHKVQVIAIKTYGDNELSLTDVTYEWYEGATAKQHTKDAWNFQVRYFNPQLDSAGGDSTDVAQRRSVWEK